MKKYEMIKIMSKIDWVEARSLYVYDERNSYGKIAKKYKVAKSTVQRHANKHHWQEDRWKFQNEISKRIKNKKLENMEKAEERQIELLQKIQNIMTRGVNYYHRIQKDDGGLSDDQFKKLMKLYSTMHKAIMFERTILGLPNRITRFTEADESYEYRKRNDMLTDEEKLAELDEITMDARKLHEHLVRLESYRNMG